MSEYKTEQKRLLLEFLAKNGDRSYTIDEIVDGIYADAGESSLGKSTVYRLISRFVLEGSVRKIADGHSRHNTYQWIGESCHHHLHLKCTGCGVVIHLDHETSHALESTLRTTLSFLLDEQQTLLFGKCKRCAANS